MSVSEFACGSVFGAALLCAGVYSPGVIKSQMIFSSNVMITVMMGASATSALVFELADRFKWVEKPRRGPSSLGLFGYDGNVIGGAMIGLGMAATGACPGTVLVQAGTGMRQAGFIAFGGILGALTYIRLLPRLKRTPSNAGTSDAPNSGAQQETEASENHSKRPLDIATALGINPVVLLSVWVLMCLGVIGIARRKDTTVNQIPASGLVPPSYGGLLIGAAQMCSILFTKHAIGASAAYRDLASWLDQKLLRGSTDRDYDPSDRPLFTPSMVFAAGVIFSAAAISQVAKAKGLLNPSAIGSGDLMSPIFALVGGACMVFGACVARGCPSGHGISGLATFSMSSLVSTAAMFSTGIATATALRSMGLLQL